MTTLASRIGFLFVVILILACSTAQIDSPPAPDGGEERAHVPVARLGAESARRADPRGRTNLAVSSPAGRVAVLVVLALVALAMVATSVLPPA